MRQGLVNAKTDAEQAAKNTLQVKEQTEKAKTEALEAAKKALEEAAKVGNINEILEDYKYRVFIQKEGEKKPLDVCFNVTEEITMPNDNIKVSQNMGLKIVE